MDTDRPSGSSPARQLSWDPSHEQGIQMPLPLCVRCLLWRHLPVMAAQRRAPAMNRTSRTPAPVQAAEEDASQTDKLGSLPYALL